MLVTFIQKFKLSTYMFVRCQIVRLKHMTKATRLWGRVGRKKQIIWIPLIKEPRYRCKDGTLLPVHISQAGYWVSAHSWGNAVMLLYDLEY